MTNSLKQRGFTLIEMVIFIVVLGIIGATLVSAFNASQSSSRTPEQTLIATELAISRMELILEQRFSQGFNNFSDPCTSSNSLRCQPDGNFTISSKITSNIDTKHIIVTVKGPGSATLETKVAKYS